MHPSSVASPGSTLSRLVVVLQTASDHAVLNNKAVPPASPQPQVTSTDAWMIAKLTMKEHPPKTTAIATIHARIDLTLKILSASSNMIMPPPSPKTRTYIGNKYIACVESSLSAASTAPGNCATNKCAIDPATSPNTSKALPSKLPPRKPRENRRRDGAMFFIADWWYLLTRFGADRCA